MLWEHREAAPDSDWGGVVVFELSLEGRMGIGQVRKGVVMGSGSGEVTSGKTSLCEDMAGQRAWHVQRGVGWGTAPT